MLVVLMLKDRLIKIKLPSKISGNYNLNASEKDYINIEGSSSGWRIKSNKSIKILKTEKEIYNEIILKNNSFYVLSFVKTGCRGFIYCSDVFIPIN